MRHGDTVEPLEFLDCLTFYHLLKPYFRPDTFCLQCKISRQTRCTWTIKVEIRGGIPSEEHDVNLLSQSAVDRNWEWGHIAVAFKLREITPPAKDIHDLLRIFKGFRDSKCNIAVSHVQIPALHRIWLIV